MAAQSEEIANKPEAGLSLPFAPKLDLAQPWIRQLGLLVVVAAGLAGLVLGVLWMSEPPPRVLYTGLSDHSLGEVIEALERSGVPYELDTSSGTLKVPSNLLHRVRVQLAAEGLPRSAESGFELLDQESGFGLSQFMEGARYQRALEGELARSVASIGSVQSARVHLAMARQSAFVRDRRPPSASVVVLLHRGRALDRGQVAAITHLVSSSVPEMRAEDVTIVDQSGALLTNHDDDDESAVSSRQLEYVRNIEEHYIRRIEEILSPILGVGAVRAQVSVEADFAATEETEEIYGNPETPLVRSEQTMEERSRGSLPLGIPGALTNQPPPPVEVGQEGENPEDPRSREPYTERAEATRNFELDKRIRHIRQLPGKVRRVTAAVVVDHRQVQGEDGELTREALSAEELERISSLVREAVGYDEARGDRVNVVNSAFADTLKAGLASPEQWWQTSWFLTLARLGTIGLVILVALLVVVRPALRALLPRHGMRVQEVDDSAKLPALDSDGDSDSEADEDEVRTLTKDEDELLPEDVVRLSQNQRELDTNYPTDITAHVKTVKDLVAADPLRAVQVIKHWVTNDG